MVWTNALRSNKNRYCATWRLPSRQLRETKKVLCGVLLISTFAACADLEMRSATLSASNSVSAPVFRLTTAAAGESSAGYETKLMAGSLWRYVGTIDEGRVYRPQGGTISARAFDDSEAYIVVNAGDWVGFWLPYEEAYSPLDHSIGIGLLPVEGGRQ